MRRARAGDYWRRVYERPFEVRLDSVAFKEVRGIGSGQICFNGAISAICGANGVGKSTLVDVLVAALDVSAMADPRPPGLRLRGSQLEAVLQKDSTSHKIQTAFDQDVGCSVSPAVEVSVELVDPATESGELSKQFSTMPNLDELLEPISPTEADEKELKELSYLVGKDYEACLTYEIDEFADKPICPYFQVQSGGASYGSETMGLGEMALFLTRWHLQRSSKNSIVVVEEPETHVTPRSEGALLDLLAKYSLKRSLWVILTTHSAGIVSRIPRENTILLFRDADGIGFINGPTESQLYSTLGMDCGRNGVLLVEDRGAREFAKAWLRHHEPDLLVVFEIKDAGGESDIENALRKFPRTEDWLRVIGLFDGDQRGRTTGEYNWPYTFLPGSDAPEIMLRTVATESAGSVAKELRRNESDVRLALGAVEGMDHHDWYEELGKRLSVDYEQLMTVLFTVWLDKEGNAECAEEAYEELVSILRPAPK